MEPTYQFEDSAAGTDPVEQKKIEVTTIVEQKSVFTLADKQREVEILTNQIDDLTKRKADLETQIADAKTALNIGSK